MTDRVGVKVVRLTADGQVSTKAAFLKAICTVHSENALGEIKFYDLAAAPGGSDTPKCTIPVQDKGTYPFYVPEPGALFEKGIYVDMPSNTSINFFFVDA
jgi:hypothetical protein